MIMFECPYPDCSGFDVLALPDMPLPKMAPHDCKACGRRVWTRLSRVNPWSMTDADFRAEWDVDEATKAVAPKHTPDATTDV